MSKGKDLINSIKYGLYRMLTLKKIKITVNADYSQIFPVSLSLFVV